jgi:sulfite exporter TauE/SafE
MELASFFIGGVLGSAHCIGMCGGFAAAIGATQRPFWPTLARQLVYSSGRIFTYAFLGALGGAAGLWLLQFRTPLVGAQQVFSIIAGVIMLLVGLSVLGVLNVRLGPPRVLSQLVGPIYRHFFAARNMAGTFGAGVATGFLPCGLVYSFLALAVASGRLERGMAQMAMFGLGTVPAMVLAGCGGKLLTFGMRQRVYRVAACFVIALGALTVWRGMPIHGEGDCCNVASSPIQLHV